MHILRDILNAYHATTSEGPLLSTKLDDLTRRSLHSAFAEVGDRWVGLHGCRRGLASNLFVLGVEPGIVQKILRHSFLSVAVAHCVKLGEAQKIDAMLRFSKSLGAERGRLVTN
jgi:hypothetical protein